MEFHNNKEKVLIIDFGSQLTKLIARRIRELVFILKYLHQKSLKIKRI